MPDYNIFMKKIKQLNSIEVHERTLNLMASIWCLSQDSHQLPEAHMHVTGRKKSVCILYFHGVFLNPT